MKRAIQALITAIVLAVTLSTTSWCDGGAPPPTCFPGHCLASSK